MPLSFTCTQRINNSVTMAEQSHSVEPQLQSGEEGVPDKVVEAVVDGDQPNGYKIVRTATGKNYVEVSAGLLARGAVIRAAGSSSSRERE